MKQTHAPATETQTAPQGLAIPDDVVARLKRNFNLAEYLSYFPAITERGRDFLKRALEGATKTPNGSCVRTTRTSSKGKIVQELASAGQHAHALQAELREDVIICITELPSLCCVYDAGGSRVPNTFFADAALLTTSGVEIDEVKVESWLRREHEKHPGLVQFQDGKFTSEPRDLVVKELGFRHYAFCWHFNHHEIQNVRTLESHLRTPCAVTDEERAVVLDYVGRNQGIAAADIPITDPSRRGDVFLRLVVDRLLFPAMNVAALSDMARIRVFTTRESRDAFEIMVKHNRAPLALPVVSRFSPNTEFVMNGAQYKVVSITDTGVVVEAIESHKLREFSYAYLANARLAFLTTSDDHLCIGEIVSSMTEERLQLFLRAYNEARPYLPGGECAGQTPKNSNLRKKVALYHKMEAVSFGSGIRVFIPKTHLRGNRKPRNPEQAAILQNLIVTRFLKPNAPTPTHIYHEFCLDVAKAGITENVWTRETVLRRLAKITKFRVKMAQGGMLAAAAYSLPSMIAAPTGPVNGFAPNMVWHGDGTQLDCYVLNEETMQWERPRLAFMRDGYSGTFKGYNLWFGGESAVHSIELIQDCIRRNGYIASMIRFDRGTGFNNERLRSTLLHLGVDVSSRRSGSGPDGGPIEAAMDIFNDRVGHNLSGTTKDAREDKPSKLADPKKFACWTMPLLRQLIEKFMATYNKSPREFQLAPDLMEKLWIRDHGSHGTRLIDHTLLDALARREIEGETRTVSAKGTIRVNTIDYGAPALQNLIGKDVRFFFDDNDPRIVWVDHPLLKERVPCTSHKLKHAESAAVAAAIIASRQGGYQRKKEADAGWRDLALTIRDMEKTLPSEVEALRDAGAARTPQPPPPPQPQAPFDGSNTPAASVTNS